MRSKIGLWGGSCAVRLPKEAVERLGLHEGSDIDIRIENDSLVIRRRRPHYRVESLVEEAKRLTPPAALDDGRVGCETL